MVGVIERLSRWAATSFALLALLATAHPAAAISIERESDAATLASALMAGASGVTVTSATLQGHGVAGSSASSGTFTNASRTYGIGPGIVLSSGDVADYADGPNQSPQTSTAYGIAATASQRKLANGITRKTLSYFDVTQLDLTFEVAPAVEAIELHVAFGSEELGLSGTDFLDGFGLFLNGRNQALVGVRPVVVNHPWMASIAGTELDELLAPGGDPLLRFSLPVQAGSNTLTLLLFDASDAINDSTVFVSTRVAHMPEPATALLLGGSLIALGCARARRRRASPSR